MTPDRYSPRWQIEVPPRWMHLKLEFCQQIGMYDVWLGPDIVLMAVAPNRNEALAQVVEYSYQHAGQRFPLIENKIMAMRAMLFGVISNE